MRFKPAFGFSVLVFIAGLLGLLFSTVQDSANTHKPCEDGALCGSGRVASAKGLAKAPQAGSEVLPSPQEVPADPLVRFDDWSRRYLAASEAERAAMMAEGMTLAKARRPIFRQIIQTDPRLALMEAVPMVVRQQLPAQIVSELEERVAARGELRVYAAGPESKEQGERPYLRYAETLDGRTYEAHVFGRREFDYQQKPGLHVVGVAMDGDLALSESPLRRLEPGEIPPMGKKQVEICPVSGKDTARALPPPTPVAETTAVVETGDEIVFLCDGAHIQAYENGLILGEAGTGGAQSFTGPMPASSVPSVGVVKVLYVPVIFADQSQTPATEALMMDGLRQTADFYRIQSYGRLTLVATVTPPVKLPRNQAWYKGKDNTDGHIKEVDGLNAEMQHAKEAARAAGYDWQDYHCFCVRATGGARSPTSYGSVGGGQVWMRSDNVSTIAHEIGHAFGLGHANFWLTNGASVAGPGGNEEYGDSFDNMGSTSPPAGHYNAQAKNQIRWMPPEFAPPITASGLYRIHAFDTPRLQPGQLYALQVRKDAERTFWGEYRTLFPSNAWVSNGMILGWKWSQNGGGNIQLLDTTPGSANGKNDSPIAVGSTFSDTESGIHLTTVAVNAATQPPSVDVQVNLGSFPGNQVPTLSLSTASPVVPTNTNVTFTATAADLDGDALAYSWRWHDGVVSPNAPTATRSFSTNGIYTLSCVVSDMKGGTAVRNAVITVGNGGSRFTISGRITKQGVGLAGVNVTTSGTNGTLTDSDGYYTISNLAAGSYSATPAGHGLVFNEEFNNSITVGPSFTGANFSVDELPVVTLTAPAAVAAEGGGSATFRLTRTGSTALPLTVNTLVVRGTAVKGSDYTFTPDYAAVANTPYFALTIPADSATLNVTVAAINDVASEGNETVELVLGLDAAYLNGSQASAIVTIQDNDTSLPRVSLSANTSQTVENGGQPVVCTLTRTGATTAALVVPYAILATSTAVNGTDYATLSGAATIPIGAASTTFEISPLDDSLAEGTEIVRLSITTGAAFIADAGANSLTIRIVDDDSQIVTLITTDASATEMDRTAPGSVPDPGTFLLTRSGDVSAPLTIYYSVAGTALHGVDYEALPGSVTFPAGETQRSISIMPRVDGYGEGAETVILAIADGNEGYRADSVNSIGTVTIADHPDDRPLLEITSIGGIASEPSTNGQFRITAKGGSGSLTVNYTVSGTATAGSDYNALSGSTTITLNGGTVTSNIAITVINDTEIEEMEDVTMTLTPSANYSLWDVSKSATLFIRDNDQPTVFADPQVGTGIAHSISESSTGTTLKFYLSRTGSTAGALTVNYTLGGTATPGTDFTNATLTGTATIPAGAPGVDLSFNTISDSAFEGTETVILQLAPGSYARGPDATLYITDDDAGAQSVSFASSGDSGSESATEVNIPVTLSSPAATPVTVDYLLETGARTPTMLSGMWVRVVRTGNTFASFYSFNGTTFTQQGSSQTIPMSSASYLAGLCVTSGSNGTLANLQIDSVQVTGLEVGGSAGAFTTSAIGTQNPTTGGYTESGGVYNIVCGGPDISTSSTTDNGRMVHVPITNSANCTITARVLGLNGTSTSQKAGVTLRETTANNSRHMSMFADNGLASRRAIWRTTLGGNAGTSQAQATYAKPRWLRLERSGNLFTSSVSADGVSWTVTGPAQPLLLSTNCLVGLAASARQDGLITQAVFDNVSLTPAATLQSRTIGFVNEQGNVTESGGTWTINASGAGFMPSASSTEDEGHMLGTNVSGDFTLTARLVSISGGNASAQAGLMVRETSNYRARALWYGLTGSGTSAPEYRARLSATSSGEGMTVDYHLTPGTLTFDVGEQTKNIVLNVTDDSIPEPVEFATILLRYPHRAHLGAFSTFTYAIVDNDETSAMLPVAGFAGAASTGLETATPASIPVILSSPASVPVTIDYATNTSGTAAAGADFTAISGTLTFAPGEVFKTISLPVLDDTLVETSETVQIELSNASATVLGTTSIHTFTISDDDTPVVTLSATDAAAAEHATTPDTGTFTFTRNSTAGSLTVNFTRSGTATSGSDYTSIATPGAVTFTDGQATTTITVTPLNNTTAESDETVILTLTSGSGYTVGSPSSATVIITDDDVNTITLTASDAIASENGTNPGEFTLTRSGPTTSALTVTIARSGTAANITDFANISTTQSFGIGVSSIIIPVTVVQDTLTEGNEEVVLSISTSASYIVGTPSVANVTIVDDDLPPSVFISSPASKSTIISSGNGLMLSATGTDDGLPSPLSYTWSQLFGPGSITFAAPAAASTAATFAAPGIYGLRITVDDGQFTATDDLIVQVGGFGYANWVGIDQGPPGVRGISGEAAGGAITLIGAGTGYTGTNDSGHMVFRQLLGGTGDANITARLVSLSGPSTRLAGLTIRDTSWKGAKRSNLLVTSAGAIQFRNRSTANAADTAATGSGLVFPCWLKLERSGGSITASTAPDAGGSPGAWTQIGSPTAITMGANLAVGMVVSAGGGNATATAQFDNISVTPAFAGTALHSEDLGNYTIAGSSSVAGAVTTVNAVGSHDGTGSHFRYQQIWGDCIITARLTSHAGATRGAQSGVALRDTTDNGPFGFYGTTTIDGFQAHWRSSAGANPSTLQTGGSIGSWIRLIRKGNSVAAYRASNVGGAPGTWAQVTGNLPAPMTGPLLVGLLVDSNSSSLVGTGTFEGLTIEPLNTAPVVDTGTLASSLPPFHLNATVTDDGRPTPPGATNVAWNLLSGPGGVTFANPAIEDTLVTLSMSGAHTLRLAADDGDSVVFDDLTFMGYLNPFAQWLDQNSVGEANNLLAEADADADNDGLANLFEYAIGTNGAIAGSNPQVVGLAPVSGSQYLRLSIPKNPAATDVTFTVEATSDLANPLSWSSAGLIIETNTSTQLVVRDNVAAGPGVQRFMRIRVARP
jgi:regulation of enolase protein 1 (concanavalin A-like superfamily)